MDNNWQQQPEYGQPAENPRPRTGGLLSNYNQQSPAQSQPNNPNAPAPYPTPPGMNPAPPMLAGPGSQYPFTQQPSTQTPAGVEYPGAHAMLHNARQLMRRWSGKSAAVNQGQQVPFPAAQPPQIYTAASSQPPQPARPWDMSQPQRSQPWKRSRTLRITRQMRLRRARWQHSQPGGTRLLTNITIALVLLLVFTSLGGTVYGYTYYQSQLPRLEGLASAAISQTSRIYDRNNVLIYESYDKDRRTPVTYNDVPQVMRDAMTSAEDPSFNDNLGIDPNGILRAGVEYAQTHSVQSGGSTITQQVIKNLSGQTQIDFNRKLSEAALAIGLTNQYPKWKILEMYFNVASFGGQDKGIEAAVEEYFNLKPNCDINFKCKLGITKLSLDDQGKTNPLLGLARASLLAGMAQNPVDYNPTLGDVHKQLALARQKYVLGQMVTYAIKVDGLGVVTPAIAKQASDLTAQMKFTPYQSIKRCRNFVDWVIRQVALALGNGNYTTGLEIFNNGGFNIRTTIDANLEDYVEAAVTRHLTQPEYQKFTGLYGPLNVQSNVNDAAVVVLNAKTGEILAMDGSSDYNSKDPRINGEYNVADPPATPNHEPGRPVGSTMKSIEYATSLQMGWYPGMVLPDFKTYFPNGTPAGTPAKDMYPPPDFSLSGDPEYHHKRASTMREATANSYNVPAMKAMAFAGSDNVLNTAKRMGITTLNHLQSLMAWGLGSEPIPLLQMTGAYQTFADNGQHVPPQGILDIWDNYGHNLFHYDTAHPPAGQVFSPEVSFLMTSVLRDEPARAIEFGGDTDLSFADKSAVCSYNAETCPYQVAAKTGTTDYYKDNLTIGYTPGVVVGVWAGNADNSSMINATGITGAAPIWHSVMEFAGMGWCNTATDKVPCPTINRDSLHIDPTTTFTPPADVYKASTSSVNGLQGGGVTDWIIKGEEPQQPGIFATPTPTPTPPNGDNGGNGGNGNGNGNGNNNGG